jgi:hypothetical protein
MNPTHSQKMDETKRQKNLSRVRAAASLGLYSMDGRRFNDAKHEGGAWHLRDAYTGVWVECAFDVRLTDHNGRPFTF